MEHAEEIWRGGVNTWECDEMGHMNVRFYVARAMEGLAGLARRLGMADAFTPHAESTLIVREHHIRFLREAVAGTPLRMTGGVVAMDGDEATLIQVLFQVRTGEPCASFITKVAHAAPKTGRPFAWPGRARAAAEALRVQIPPYAAPRSINGEAVVPAASMARAEALGLGCAASGAIMADSCDIFGRMRAEAFIGRVSDGVPGLLGRVRTAGDRGGAAKGRPRRRRGPGVSPALSRLAPSGRTISISAPASPTSRTRPSAWWHWLLDPVTGKAWGSAEAVAVNLDLDVRKIIPISPEARAVLKDYVVEGLTL